MNEEHMTSRQGEPVAWMLTPPGCVPALVFAGIGLKEPKPSKYATPLYTHSDPAEAERLHSRLREEQAYVSELAEQNTALEKERDTLRAQLAEAHELFHECFAANFTWPADLEDRIDAHLSTSTSGGFK